MSRLPGTQLEWAMRTIEHLREGHRRRSAWEHRCRSAGEVVVARLIEYNDRLIERAQVAEAKSMEATALAYQYQRQLVAARKRIIELGQQAGTRPEEKLARGQEGVHE